MAKNLTIQIPASSGSFLPSSRAVKWAAATPYHPSVKSFRLAAAINGRRVYGRTTHRQTGLCILDFHYLDDDTRVICSSPPFRVYDVVDQPIAIFCAGHGIFPSGLDPQIYLLNTSRNYEIRDPFSVVLTRIAFHPRVLSASGNSQVEGAIIHFKENVFESPLDNPLFNPPEHRSSSFMDGFLGHH